MVQMNGNTHRLESQEKSADTRWEQGVALTS